MKLSAYLLCLFIYLQVTGHLSDAAKGCCSNGFPSRLVYSVDFRTVGPSTRLIPEMSFTCNGVIVGYTAALRQQNRDEDPIIQVWRENTSQPASYDKTSAGIAIDNALCVGGLMVTEESSEVFHCYLNMTKIRVPVQPGDILGLELPPWYNDDIILAFARVRGGPTNYVFNRQGLTSPVNLSSRNSVNWDLPQITLEIESDSNDCTRGFPDFPMSRVSGRTSNSGITTLLIPEMNFTCNLSIVGFIVAGTNLNSGPHSQVQIWRKNTSQNSLIYDQVGGITVFVSTANGGTCVATQTIVSSTFLCLLHENFQVSVQPGDIFGLELPSTNNNEIFFKSGGPTNYIFERRLDFSVNLSNSGSYSIAQQLPQIVFNFTSEHCLSGFPDEVLFAGNGRGERDRVTTRLFPDMKFGCSGTIVRVTAAVRDDDGAQTPKIQIWRENETHPGFYYKMSSDIQIKRSNPPCYQNTFSNGSGIFQCTLREEDHVSVQPGDFLGLEIPSITNDDFEVYFKAGGPTNLVFQHQLDSTIDLSIEPHVVTNDEPQIVVLVVLAESTTDTCPYGASTTTPSITTQTNPKESDSTTTIATRFESSPDASNATTIITGSMGTLITILLLIVVILLMVVFILIQQRISKRKPINADSIPAYDGGGLEKQSHAMIKCKVGTNENTNAADDDKSLLKDAIDCDVEGESGAYPNPAYGVSSRGRPIVQKGTVDNCNKSGTCLNPAYGVMRRDLPPDSDEASAGYYEVTVLK